MISNIHISPKVLKILDEVIPKLIKGPDMNTRFRLWLSCTPTASIPANVLQKSLKAAVRPSSNIKSHFNEMLKIQAKEQFFKKSGKSNTFHKNLFFGLAYLHANLITRSKYGTLGWNLDYQFDLSDFEVSNMQLQEQIKKRLPKA